MEIVWKWEHQRNAPVVLALGKINISDVIVFEAELIFILWVGRAIYVRKYHIMSRWA